MSDNAEYSLIRDSESPISKEANFVFIDNLSNLGKIFFLTYQLKESS